MQKIIFLVLAFMPSSSAAIVKNPDTLVYAHMGEITTLDPIYSYDAITHGMIFNVYETLIGFKGDSLTVFEPLLAEKVPSVANRLISNDGLVYKFPVKKNVKFHNGKIMSAEDVKYSILRFMLIDPPGGPASLLLEPVFGISSTRDSSGKITVSKEEFENAVKTEGGMVVIKLKKPFAPFLSIMARWSYIINKEWCVSGGEWDGTFETLAKFNNRPKESSFLFKTMNGTGPFKFERWDLNSKQLLLGRFDGYWRKPAKLKRVIMKTVPEFGTRRLMLEAGDADIIDVPRPFEPQVKGLNGVRVFDNLPRLMTDPVFFFTFKVNPIANPDMGSGKLDGEGIPPDFFSDINARKAFCHAFDYEGFLNQALKGKAFAAKGSIPPGIFGYDPKIPSCKFDKQKATEYFMKAFNGHVWEKGFKFTLTYNTGGDVRQLACEVLKRNVESINPKFRIELRGVDWPIYLEKTQNKKMPLFTRGWTGDYPDAHNFIFPFYHSNGRYPIAQAYSNPEMDKMIELAVTETNTAKRRELYSKIQKKAFEETVQIYAVHPQGLAVMRDWVKGFLDNPVFMGIYFYPLSKR
ncbi:MAG: ABC transporter substrate-binding protein [Elusimicrobia bacterium]|nr:ABC transporter substrate-binding protein [Elusimicrobiota bacterium]